MFHWTCMLFRRGTVGWTWAYLSIHRKIEGVWLSFQCQLTHKVTSNGTRERKIRIDGVEGNLIFLCHIRDGCRFQWHWRNFQLSSFYLIDVREFIQIPKGVQPGQVVVLRGKGNLWNLRNASPDLVKCWWS
jgi:hypothetical protein